MDEVTTGDTGSTTVETPSAPTEERTFDVQATSDRIAQELFPSLREEEEASGPEAGPQVTPVAETPAPEPVAPVVPMKEVPKSWPPEMKDHWAKMPPETQDYWTLREKQMVEGLDQYKGAAQFAKSMTDVISPFQEVLRQANMQPQQAVQYLLNAHVRLTQGTPESRQAAYQELGRNLGLSQPAPNGEPTAPVDPRVQSLEQQMNQIRQELTTRQQADLTAAQERVSQEVEVFASDAKAHPYFDEVADDITALLKGGVASTLQDAYDRAVRMNPVTYAKEVAQAQQAEAAKLKENARLDALKAKTAASSNVRSRDSKRTPTEPVGSMEDTIKEALRNRKASVASQSQGV